MAEAELQLPGIEVTKVVESDVDGEPVNEEDDKDDDAAEKEPLTGGDPALAKG